MEVLRSETGEALPRLSSLRALIDWGMKHVLVLRHRNSICRNQMSIHVPCCMGDLHEMLRKVVIYFLWHERWIDVACVHDRKWSHVHVIFTVMSFLGACNNDITCSTDFLLGFSIRNFHGCDPGAVHQSSCGLPGTSLGQSGRSLCRRRFFGPKNGWSLDQKVSSLNELSWMCFRWVFCVELWAQTPSSWCNWPCQTFEWGLLSHVVTTAFAGATLGILVSWG